MLNSLSTETVSGLKACLKNINDLMISENKETADSLIRPFIGKDITGGYQLHEKNGHYYFHHPKKGIIE